MDAPAASTATLRPCQQDAKLPAQNHLRRIALLAVPVLAAAPGRAAAIVQTFTASQTVTITSPTTALTIALDNGAARRHRFLALHPHRLFQPGPGLGALRRGSRTASRGWRAKNPRGRE
jgi:hypothetical protein